MTKMKDILIIDDSEKIISGLKQLLSDVKAIGSIKAAVNIKDGEEIVFHDRPDVVILDIQLPDDNGLDLLKKIKEELPETMIIMFSDQITMFGDIYKKRFGADHFVDKSTEFEKIADILNEKFSS